MSAARLNARHSVPGAAKRPREARAAFAGRFRWTHALHEELLTSLRELKYEMDEGGEDFDGDGPWQIESVRAKIAKLHSDDPGMFGPEIKFELPAGEGYSAEQLDMARERARSETLLVERGYSRVRHKLKELRQAYEETGDVHTGKIRCKTLEENPRLLTLMNDIFRSASKTSKSWDEDDDATLSLPMHAQEQAPEFACENSPAATGQGILTQCAPPAHCIEGFSRTSMKIATATDPRMVDPPPLTTTTRSASIRQQLKVLEDPDPTPLEMGDRVSPPLVRDNGVAGLDTGAIAERLCHSMDTMSTAVASLSVTMSTMGTCIAKSIDLVQQLVVSRPSPSSAGSGSAGSGGGLQPAATANHHPALHAVLHDLDTATMGLRDQAKHLAPTSSQTNTPPPRPIVNGGAHRSASTGERSFSIGDRAYSPSHHLGTGKRKHTSSASSVEEFYNTGGT